MSVSRTTAMFLVTGVSSACVIEKPTVRVATTDRI